MTRDFYMNHVRKGTQNIKRFGMEDVTKPQNLADHGYQVMNLFLIACDFMAYNPTVKELDKVLNHDAIETLTGDLNKVVKEWNETTKKAWAMIELEIVPSEAAIYLDDGWHPEGDGPNTFTKHQKFEDLWKFCDAMDAYLYCLEERQRGNQNLISVEGYYLSKLNLMNKPLFGYIKYGD